MNPLDQKRGNYRDLNGKPHEIVLRGRLVLDIAPAAQPRVLCELDRQPLPRNKKEALEQRDSREREIDAVVNRYIEQAPFAERPLARPLAAEDLAARPGDQIQIGA